MSIPGSQSLLRRIKNRPKNIFMILLWLIAVAGAMISLYPSLSGFTVVVGLSSFIFIILLIWTLSQKKPYAEDLPNIDFVLTPWVSFGVAFGSIIAGLGALFVIGLAIGPAVSILLVSALIGLGLAISWRSQLTLRLVVIGFMVGLMAGLGITFLGNGDLSWAIYNFVTLPPTFISGALLIKRTDLAKSRFLQAEYSLALQGFLWACLIAVPAALLNLLGGVHEGDSWVNHWWQPLYSLVPGIAEETWARLFLTTLCYALLRPTINQHPRRAILIAVMVGALVHGFGHTGIHPISLLVGSLLYGIPAALLFIKYDFEHAVGYHFLIDLIRYVAAFLQP